MFALFGCGLFIVPIVLFVWAIVTIVRAITLPRNAARFAACERCGYAVADLTSFTCPECGVDLRNGGIITPAIIARTRGSLTSAILAWTYIAGFVAYLAFTLSIGFLSVGGAAWTSFSANTSWSNNLTPTSGNYQSLEILFDHDYTSVTSDIDLTLGDTGGTLHTISLDPNTMQITGLATSPTTWSPITIETWYAQLGLDTTDAQILAEAAEVTREVDLALRSPSSSMAPSNLREHTSNAMPVASTATPITPPPAFGPPPAVWLAATAVGLLIYALGIVFIVRRRSTLLRRAV